MSKKSKASKNKSIKFHLDNFKHVLDEIFTFDHKKETLRINFSGDFLLEAIGSLYIASIKLIEAFERDVVIVHEDSKIEDSVPDEENLS